MFWLFGSRSVRQAEKCLVLFLLSKDYLESGHSSWKTFKSNQETEMDN